MNDLIDIGFELIESLKEFASALSEGLLGGELGKWVISQMNFDLMMHSIWFPALVVIICVFCAYKNHPGVAASVFIATCIMYIFYFIVPQMGNDLVGVLYFGFALIAVTMVGIYFLFIKED